VITEQLEAGTAIKSKPVHKCNNQNLQRINLPVQVDKLNDRDKFMNSIVLA